MLKLTREPYEKDPIQVKRNKRTLVSLVCRSDTPHKGREKKKDTKKSTFLIYYVVFIPISLCSNRTLNKYSTLDCI